MKTSNDTIALQGMAEHRFSNVYNHQMFDVDSDFPPHSLFLLFAVHFPKKQGA